MLRELFDSIDLTKTLLAVLVCSQCYVFTTNLRLQKDVQYLWEEVFTEDAPRFKRSAADGDGGAPVLQAQTAMALWLQERLQEVVVRRMVVAISAWMM